MTIDPARRLANALGIDDFGNVERELPPELLAPYGVELKAPLWVMMPDVKRTFDELIGRTAPSEGIRQKIIRNRIYQHFSSALAGSHEFAAVEKLYEVYADHRYDLIVLDTPPAQDAVEFLEAPGRVLDFFDNDTLQWLLKPYILSGRFSLRVFDLSTSFLLRTLGKLAGGETLRELAEFIFSFRGMYDSFRDRSRAVRELLASEETAFVLVTATGLEQRQAMLRFRRELLEEGLAVRSVIANRVRLAPPPAAERAAQEAEAARLLQPLGDEVVREVLEAVREELHLAEADARAVAELRETLAGTPLLVLSELPTDVHDLAGLARLQSFLSSGGKDTVDTPSGTTDSLR